MKGVAVVSLFWLALGAAANAQAPRIADYRPIFDACRDAGGAQRLAIRALTLDGVKHVLSVDPQTLATRVEAAAGLTCAPTADEAQKDTRFVRALRGAGREITTASGVSRNAGLIHGSGGGVFVTGDLCPTNKPLDRGFLELLTRQGAGTPVALAISGNWLKRHGADFDWLRGLKARGALDITWVNHSTRHPYVRGLAETQNYLMTPGADLDAEIFETEKLLIEHGETPSVFFRFPGLVADAALMDKLRARHLVALGADAWLALTGRAQAGSIVLTHPNGNEPYGLKLFARLLEQGKLPKPFRRLNEAP